MAALPMFPLGTVLLPGAVLPLNVFEPRYQALVRDCLAAEWPEFGVVLIERGFEVGGGDVRAGVGTVARIVQRADLGGGRSALVTVGVRRVRVRSWLPDDPYPRADVEDWDDEPGAAPDDLAALFDATVARLRRTLALAAEVGARTADATIELAADPVLGSYQAAAVAPLGPADAFRLLAAPDVAARLALLADLLDDADAVLRFGLAAGGDPPDEA